MASRTAAERLPLAKNLFFTTARGRVQSRQADIFRSSHFGRLLSFRTETREGMRDSKRVRQNNRHLRDTEQGPMTKSATSFIALSSFSAFSN
jgi:hypothetical protein